MEPISGRIRPGRGGEDIRLALERNADSGLGRETYSYARVLDMAGEPDANGWRSVEIDVQDGETAVHPASTKRVLYGPVKLRYDIHPSGVTCTIIGGEVS